MKIINKLKLNIVTNKKLMIITYSLIGLLIIFSLWFIIKKNKIQTETKEESAKKHVFITAEAMKISNISTEVVQSKSFKTVLKTYGQIIPNMDKYARINSRYSGIVREVYKQLGDQVKAGEILASIDLNNSYSKYDITAKAPGAIVDMNIVKGKYISDRDNIFTIANLENVWIDFNILMKDYSKIRVGQVVRFTLLDTEEIQEAPIYSISPTVHDDSQSLSARSFLPNKGYLWRPGSFVNVDIVIEDRLVPMTIKQNSIQIIDEKAVVFVKVNSVENQEQNEDGHHSGYKFEPRAITKGRSGEGYVEILEGLKPGDEYISQNSFILKSELLKSSIEED